MRLLRSWRTNFAGLALAAAALVGLAPPSLADRSDGNFFDFLFGEQQEAPKSPEELKKARDIATRQEDKLLEQLRPNHVLVTHEAEQALQAAIDRYQTIAVKGGWPGVPNGRTLRPGDMDEAVESLRRRLQITDGLQPPSGNSWVFDEEVQAAVMRFQRRHGIPPSGIVDRRTLLALNVSAAARLSQLRVNLLRMRELLGIGMPVRYVLVNVPAFELQAIEGDRIAIYSRVIVGRPERPTPTVAAKIKGLNFFPYWHVPDSVAFGDLVPKLDKDPDYLVREKIRVLASDNGAELDPRTVDWRAQESQAFRFRQDPGDQNALGLVRIDMPNEHTVYMHDTPLKNLFARSARAYSAGCVRVQKVFDLVAWLASLNGDWDRSRIDGVLETRMQLDVPFEQQIDVYFVYLTAWASPKGEASFRPDIYGRDGAAEAIARDEREPPPTESFSLAP